MKSLTQLYGDETGTGTLALDAINTEIANLSETIANNKTGFENFMKTFDTDTAKGISANIDRLAKGLESAAAGLTPTKGATLAITKATGESVELAEKATKVFELTDVNLKTMATKLKKMKDRLDDIDKDIAN